MQAHSRIIQQNVSRRLQAKSCFTVGTVTEFILETHAMCSGVRWFIMGQNGIQLETKTSCRYSVALSYLFKKKKNEFMADYYRLGAGIGWGSYIG